MDPRQITVAGTIRNSTNNRYIMGLIAVYTGNNALAPDYVFVRWQKVRSPT